MASVSAVGIAGDVLQRNDSVADVTKDKHIQISITPIEDDEISTTGKHSVDSLTSERSQQSIEGQVARLREEIAVANNVLELCIREAVTAGTTLEKKKLQERTNAAYTAWAAKELVLNDLLNSMQYSDDSSTYSSSTTSTRQLSVQPYPTNKMHVRKSSQVLSDESASATAFMKQIGWVSPASLVQYLNSGIDVNGLGQFPGYPQHPITPLMAIIRSPFVTESTEIIELLLEQDADPCIRDNQGLSSFAHAIYARRKDVIRLFIQTLLSYERSGFPTGSASMNLDTTWTGVKHLRWEAAEAIISYDMPTLTTLLSDSSAHNTILHTACLPLAILFNNMPAVQALLAYGMNSFQLFRRSPAHPSRPFTSPVSLAIYTENLTILQTLLFQDFETSERRGRIWYAQLFASMPSTYSNTGIIDFILDNVPLVEAFDRAIRCEDRVWIHRIVIRTVSLLLTPSDDRTGARNMAAEAFATLFDRAWNLKLCERRELATEIVDMVEQGAERDFTFVACGGTLGISPKMVDRLLIAAKGQE
ncbi:uncharacterized protein M421DRAFT_417914 [Didymella exigua CBS 183.55]|uniref:Uncharacterized protein n=1 Tax=Didymella exigua CBS 183.55 TaxID=1150837 RepID=A0A6A5RVS9_9PLEO|nr:uncharacterized protein M421DRAFT_417914 [Didymella exigua CBS 183.55]KAF1931264.1 hypothetical protein M421DRAFT_417914 [Didymella exigua CBS 183.55]